MCQKKWMILKKIKNYNDKKKSEPYIRQCYLIAWGV